MIEKRQKGAEKCQYLLDHVRVVQMGILNATPDSFSDGGRHNTVESALNHSLELVNSGAHVIDIGGASTRPGSVMPSVDEEWERVSEILSALRKNLPQHILLSLDTCSPEVALRAAKRNLIDIINDVCAAQVSAKMDGKSEDNADWPQEITTADVAAKFGLGLVLMHMQGETRTMQCNPTYRDCVDEVTAFLVDRIRVARDLGVQWCAVDPGIGFGKTLEHNLELLSARGIASLSSTGVPLLIGLSRKSFLKALAERTGDFPSFDSSMEELKWRDEQSSIWEQACIERGAKIIRTHSIKRA